MRNYTSNQFIAASCAILVVSILTLISFCSPYWVEYDSSFMGIWEVMIDLKLFF